MAKAIIAESEAERAGERSRRSGAKGCAGCGAMDKALLKDTPTGLSYKEKQVYKGRYYCLSCLPKNNELPTKELPGTVL